MSFPSGVLVCELTITPLVQSWGVIARKIETTPVEKDDIEYHAILEVSRSENLLDFVHMEQDHEQSQSGSNNHEKIPHC